MTTTTAKEIASKLLEIKAVFLKPDDPFTWASGIKSPIYCDNRMTMSYPEVRKMIKDGFLEIIKNNYPETEIIAGTATAGIPHAAWLADALDLPMIYIRSGSKSHGRTNQIEGLLEKDKKVVVIEDLISTGGSSIQAAEAVKEAGAKVLGIAAIFTYQLEKANQAFEKSGIPLTTLSNYETLIEVAKENGTISENQIEKLTSWKKDPENFGK